MDVSNGTVRTDSPNTDPATALIINQFEDCIEALKQNDLNLANAVLKKANEYVDTLESRYQRRRSPPVTNPNILIDALPSATISGLHEIAKRMAEAGLGKECSHVYGSCRRKFLKMCLLRLGLGELSNARFRSMPPLGIKYLIRIWIKAANIALKVLFSSERLLYDRVFLGFSSDADLFFMENWRESTNQLLNFAHAVAIGTDSENEELFGILDVFETLRDLFPEVEAIFSHPDGVSVKDEARKVLNRLEEAIKGIFPKFWEMLPRALYETDAPDGRLHPLTQYVMAYLRAACKSRQALEQVLEEHGRSSNNNPRSHDTVASSSSLSKQIARIMEELESTLEAESKLYNDTALRHVFLMNNGSYIVQEAKDSELGILLGNDWIQKHTSKVKENLEHYQRSSWNKVLELLKLDSNGSVPPKEAAEPMKKKLLLFNLEFEEICSGQSTWYVFGEQLKEEIKKSLENILLQAYGNFIGRCDPYAKEYMRYGMDHLQAGINGLFQGGPR